MKNSQDQHTSLTDQATALFRRSLSHLPKQVRLYLLNIMGRRRLSQKEFQKLSLNFGNDLTSRARYLVRTYHCRSQIDPKMVRIIKKLKDDFNLNNFIETGTFDGDTSLLFCSIFDKVYTCDVIDHQRRIEFWLQDNLIYETKSSQHFLKDHLSQIKSSSLFFLDAHWEKYWPLRDELSIVFTECINPVVVLDDFDAGNGLEFDSYCGIKLDFEYIADLVPPGYKFLVNTSSNRNKGMIFLFPDSVPYGCPFATRKNYSETCHGLWGKI